MDREFAGTVPLVQEVALAQTVLVLFQAKTGAGSMVIVKVWGALAPRGLLAVYVTTVVPVAVGVPVIIPVAWFRLRPVGRLPVAISYDVGTEEGVVVLVVIW